MKDFKERVLKANLDLVKHGLVLFTWGNVSAFDREKGLVAIKPSGVPYSEMKEEDIVIVDLEGRTVEGKLRPSSDLPTHLEIYKSFPNIGGVAHTHSTYATAWAQAGKDIPCFGTTHADYFYGSIPCTRSLTEEEVKTEYEKNTGAVIIERLREIDPVAVPAIIVKNHGMFSIGSDGDDAVFHAVVCEEVARMALLTLQIDPLAQSAPKYLLDKHYSRKHGKDAYYGQK